MTDKQLIHLIDRIKFCYEKAEDYRIAHKEALETIKRTDIDAYREVTGTIAAKADNKYQYWMNELKQAKNTLKNELNQE